MIDPGQLVLGVMSMAVFFYVLYGVARAAVRDGTLQAFARIKEAEEEAESNDPARESQ